MPTTLARAPTTCATCSLPTACCPARDDALVRLEAWAADRVKSVD